MPNAEIVFQVREAPEGGYTARAVGYSIFTQGDDWEHLREMMRDAVLCHFDDEEAPQAIRVIGPQDDVALRNYLKTGCPPYPPFPRKRESTSQPDYWPSLSESTGC